MSKREQVRQRVLDKVAAEGQEKLSKAIGKEAQQLIKVHNEMNMRKLQGLPGDDSQLIAMLVKQMTVMQSEIEALKSQLKTPAVKEKESKEDLPK